MRLYRVQAEIQEIGDVFVRFTLGDELQNLALAGT
jgi:hypothetical protein